MQPRATLFSPPLLLLLCVSVLATSALCAIKVDPSRSVLIDDVGRERVFHGVNVVFKPAPFVPPVTDRFDPVLSLAPEDAKLLRQWGLNVVRLHVAWEGLEPQRGQYNTTYLEAVAGVVATLAAENIYVILDAHQDIYNRKTCGEGAPDWAAVSPTGKDAFPSPMPIHLRFDSKGYPLVEDCLQHQFGEFYLTHAVGGAFQALYDNYQGIADSFANFWGQVAKRFANVPNVLGYELINEPWAGDVLTHPSLILELGHADKVNLAPLYERVAKQIRQYDTQKLVFYEPTTTDVYPLGFPSGPLGPEYNDRNVLAYHVYCPLVKDDGNPKWLWFCDKEEAEWISVHVTEGKRLQNGLFMTEWGAESNSTDGINSIHDFLGYADNYMQSWTYWQYKYYLDYTTQNHPPQGESLWDVNGQLETNKVAALSRTYAQAIAGRNPKMSFDYRTAAFTLSYTIDATVSTHPTLIYLNRPVYYPHGFTCTVSASTLGTCFVTTTDTNVLQVVHTNPAASAGQTISISISAAPQ